MGQRWQVWGRGVAALALVWLLAVAAIGLLRGQRITAEKTLAYLRDHPLADLTPAERQHVIAEAADRVNRLSFEERQRFRNERELRRWFEQLTEEERRHYIQLTLPKGVKHTMASFRSMPPAKRKRIVNRALVDMERLRSEMDNTEMFLALSDETVRQLIEEGIEEFYKDASDDAQLELLPLIEQIQHILQMGR